MAVLSNDEMNDMFRFFVQFHAGTAMENAIPVIAIDGVSYIPAFDLISSFHAQSKQNTRRNNYDEWSVPRGHLEITIHNDEWHHDLACWH